MTTTKSMFLEAPDGHIDARMLPLIQKWDDEPTAIQLLEVVDHCIWGSLASGFALSTMQMLLDTAITREGTTRQELTKLATWRDRL